MPIADAQKIAHIPNGLVDSEDGDTARRGAMQALQNLIPSPTTVGLFQPRPAGFNLTTFPGFSSPGYISVSMVILPRIYGMIASARNPGFDEPFCYDSSTGQFVTISGVTGSNVPASPATSGAWTPPTMDIVGAKIIITHPGFSGSGSNFVGQIDIGTLSSPSWTTFNTGTNALPSVPTGVANFNDRAYYICGNVLYYSDVLAPGTITNATQNLTLGGSDPVIKLAPQPFFTTQSGGVIAALLGIKQNQIFQITGDSALSTLALNKLADGIGTLAPRSVVNTEVGVILLDEAGIRTVSLQGQVSPPNPDLKNPFLRCQVPSRAAAAYSAGVYRISLTYLKAGSMSQADYWLDVERQLWTGPHTYSYDNIQDFGQNFIATSPLVPGVIEQSNTNPGDFDGFDERGVEMKFDYYTVVLPQSQLMTQKNLVETSLFMGFASQQTLTVTARDVSGNAIVPSTSINTVFNAPAGVVQRGVYFSEPVVFARMAMEVSGTCTNGLRLGALSLHYQDLGYVNVDIMPLNTVPNPWDFGLVTDSNLPNILDWGSVIDSVSASQDFGTVP